MGCLLCWRARAPVFQGFRLIHRTNLYEGAAVDGPARQEKRVQASLHPVPFKNRGSVILENCWSRNQPAVKLQSHTDLTTRQAFHFRRGVPNETVLSLSEVQET